MVELAGSEFNNPHPATNRSALCPPPRPGGNKSPEASSSLSSLVFCFSFSSTIYY